MSVVFVCFSCNRYWHCFGCFSLLFYPYMLLKQPSFTIRTCVFVLFLFVSFESAFPTFHVRPRLFWEKVCVVRGHFRIKNRSYITAFAAAVVDLSYYTSSYISYGLSRLKYFISPSSRSSFCSLYFPFLFFFHLFNMSKRSTCVLKVFRFLSGFLRNPFNVRSDGKL